MHNLQLDDNEKEVLSTSIYMRMKRLIDVATHTINVTNLAEYESELIMLNRILNRLEGFKTDIGMFTAYFEEKGAIQHD